MIEELATGTAQPEPHDESEGTYFTEWERPPAACAVDWSTQAPGIEAMVRALNFGPYPNAMGSPKAFRSSVAEEPFVISSARAETDGTSGAGPGEVVAITEENLLVATGDGVLAIQSATTADGTELTIAELVSRFRLTHGARLDAMEPDRRDRLTQLNEVSSRHESFWTKRLSALDRVEIPFAAREDESTGPDSSESAVRIPEAFKEAFSDAREAALITAFAACLARIGRKGSFHLAFWNESLRETVTRFPGWFLDHVPLQIDLDSEGSFSDAVDRLRRELASVSERGAILRDLFARQPDLAEVRVLSDRALLPVGVRLGETRLDLPHGAALRLDVTAKGDARLVFDRLRLSAEDLAHVKLGLEAFLAAASADPDTRWCLLPLMPQEEVERVVHDWNGTAVEFRQDRCIHELFEEQVLKTPDATAIVFEDQELTYSELNDRANQLAHDLIFRGAGPDRLVGVHVERSLELMIAVLGVLKSGAAYVPLDPAFPPDRIAFMIEDAGLEIIVSHGELAVPDQATVCVRIDRDWDDIARCPTDDVRGDVRSEHLAYVIYTSGSTGRPKGVMVEHRNVMNFFTGMDGVIAHDPPGVWLAVTSLSFDISVLELFWTLARGFKVVIYRDRTRAGEDLSEDVPAEVSARGMQFGLFLWGADDTPGPDKYRLMLEGARFFDENGFDSVWTPERHFHAFGGAFPNPSVTGAALAAVTKNLSIRAGSCVSPLHHPIRIAEEWAVVDNLSGGRVGVSFAAGWQPNDFVLRPENHADNKAVMIEQIETVRRLWRGERVSFPNPMGDQVDTLTLPRPVQEELPVWITAAGNPDTYRLAGELGGNLLTHLLGQSVDELAEKIAIYRQAREALNKTGVVSWYETTGEL